MITGRAGVAIGLGVSRDARRASSSAAERRAASVASPSACCRAAIDVAGARA